MPDTVSCDVCGTVRPVADMDEVPGIGWMCKVQFDCKPPPHVKQEGYG